MPPLNLAGRINPNVTLALFVLQQRSLGCPSIRYPWLHQIGWGWDGSVDALGQRQVLDPLYFWNNRISPGGPLAAGMVVVNLKNECGPGRDDASVFIREGREYYNQVPRPGYTKYQYPHPLAVSPSQPASSSNLVAPSDMDIK
jgi:hypothetical protein